MLTEEQTFQEWLEGSYWPLMGRDGEDDDTDATSDDDTSDANDDTVDDDTTAGGTEDHTDDVDSEDDTDDDADTTVDADEDELERVRAERDRYRQQVASAEAAVQKAKKEARKAREEAAKKGGNWEQVAKERETELQEANERAQEAETRAVTAEDNLDSFRREVRITRIAARLSFKDPQDAILQMAGQSEATGDDKACERALRKLAETKPYLVDQRRARGRAMSDGNGDGGLSFDQLKNMTPEEVNAHWESGRVQKALTRGPRGG